MRTAKPPKKSETLEIRLPYEAKQAFMARCQREGRSASEALRGFIDAELAPAPQARPRRLRLMAGALIAAAVGAAALPSLAHVQTPAADALRRAAFAQLDANHDGVLTLDEYRR
jgi:anti-sigma factor RsiW